MKLGQAFFNQFGLTEAQLVIRALVLILCASILFIVAHTVVDFVRYLAFRFKFRQSFIPRSWLFVALTSCWTLLTPARSQAVDSSPSVSLGESKPPTERNQFDQINSLFTCSVVVAGLLLEIGKIRGRQLSRLEAHSRLNHPSTTATLIEKSLRAVQSSQASKEFKPIEILLPANSDAPVFVPLGTSNSQQIYVDLGKSSAVSIASNEKTEQLAVFNALIISVLFASSNRLRVILFSNKLNQPTEFSGVSAVSSFAEVLRLAELSRTNCVVFSRETLSDNEIAQLQNLGASIVCLHAIANATTTLHGVDSNWQLWPKNISINPFGLSGSQVAALGELITDVVRCANEATGGRATQANAVVALENVHDYKVLVRTLGPVDVQLADGTIVKFEKSKTKELLAWLTNHRSRPTRSAARTALWEFTVADATFTNVVSDIRRTLNHTDLLSPLEEWIPRTFSDQLPFHKSIISDGELLQACVVRAHELPSEVAVAELHRALELVRDLPFAGTGYLWPDAEGITSQLVMTVITAATMAAEIDLKRGCIDGVFWATAQGLKVLGAHEELFALRMKAHALRGDSAGVRFEFDSYLRAINSDSFSIAEPSQKLVSLLNILTNSRATEKCVALAR